MIYDLRIFCVDLHIPKNFCTFAFSNRDNMQNITYKSVVIDQNFASDSFCRGDYPHRVEVHDFTPPPNEITTSFSDGLSPFLGLLPYYFKILSSYYILPVKRLFGGIFFNVVNSD